MEDSERTWDRAPVRSVGLLSRFGDGKDLPRDLQACPLRRSGRSGGRDRSAVEWAASGRRAKSTPTPGSPGPSGMTRPRFGSQSEDPAPSHLESGVAAMCVCGNEPSVLAHGGGPMPSRGRRGVATDVKNASSRRSHGDENTHAWRPPHRTDIRSEAVLCRSLEGTCVSS